MHAECGDWVSDGDFFGHDIPGTGTLAVNRDECIELCEQKEGCNAVTFKKFTNKCWMKSLPEGVAHIYDWESDTILLCPEETVSTGACSHDVSSWRKLRNDTLDGRTRCFELST